MKKCFLINYKIYIQFVAELVKYINTFANFHPDRLCRHLLAVIFLKQIVWCTLRNIAYSLKIAKLYAIALVIDPPIKL